MGAAAAAFKEAGNKDFVSFKKAAADRAGPFAVAAEAVNAAAYVHETVFAAVQGGEGHGAYQLPVFQLGGTYRAGLGIAGRAFAAGFKVAAFAGPYTPAPCPRGNSYA